MTTATRTIRKLIRGPKPINGWGEGAFIKAEVRFDDECGNGHDSFAITGEIYIPSRRDCEACGCLHDEVAQAFPDLAPYVRWHLTSTDGPMHYMANAIYHAGFCLGMEKARNLDHLKSTIVFGAVESDAGVDLETMTPDEMLLFLAARFPALMLQFKADMKALFGDDLVIEVASEPHAWSGTLSTPENRAVIRAKKRQQIIDQTDATINKATTERDGKLWAFDYGLDIENLIYYSHTGIFTFGWREKVSDAEASKILDVISEFPFEYEIKAQSRNYSGRE
jgi:hypothetical protein